MKILHKRHILELVRVGPVLVSVHRAADRFLIDHERPAHRFFALWIRLPLVAQTATTTTDEGRKDWPLSLVSNERLHSDRNVDPLAGTGGHTWITGARFNEAHRWSGQPHALSRLHHSAGCAGAREVITAPLSLFARRHKHATFIALPKRGCPLSDECNRKRPLSIEVQRKRREFSDEIQTIERE